jgi:hypothetical protein
MRRTLTSLLRWLTLLAWRDIASVPLDCAVELAVIDVEQHRLGFPCLRHGDRWLDAATMQPVKVSPTHWRYWQPDVLPMSCC